MQKECTTFNFSKTECDIWQLEKAGMSDKQICQMTGMTFNQLERIKTSIKRKRYLTNEAAKDEQKRQQAKQQ